MSVLCFLSPIFRTLSALLKYEGLLNLWRIAFHARSPEYALKSAHMRVIFLRYRVVYEMT